MRVYWKDYKVTIKQNIRTWQKKKKKKTNIGKKNWFDTTKKIKNYLRFLILLHHNLIISGDFKRLFPV